MSRPEEVDEAIVALQTLLAPLTAEERIAVIQHVGSQFCLYTKGCGRVLLPGETCHCENDE